jgi:hypothetical protein
MPPFSNHRIQWEKSMLDIAFIAGLFGFFGVFYAFSLACNRL